MIWITSPIWLFYFAALAGGIIAQGKSRPDQAAHTVLLIKGPIHYDFLLPITPQVRQRFGFLDTAGVPILHEGAEWLVVGWGAAGFYTTVGGYSDLTFGAVARGVTGDESVLRFDVFGPLYPNPDLQALRLTQGEFDLLIGGILGDMSDQTPLDTPGFGATDVFYPATPRFHIFQTCNVWIGQKLRDAGVKFGIWTPLTVSVNLSLTLYTKDVYTRP